MINQSACICNCICVNHIPHCPLAMKGCDAVFIRQEQDKAASWPTFPDESSVAGHTVGHVGSCRTRLRDCDCKLTVVTWKHR